MYKFGRFIRYHQLRFPRLPLSRYLSFTAIQQQKNLNKSVPSAPLPVTMTGSDSTVPGVLDVLQENALKERCILVDEDDRVIGSTTKEDCHRVQSDNKTVKLHRAFSVFLFNGKGEMLMQRRSQHKITFPGMYTNACCSHPLYDIESERQESTNAIGIRRAAQRRLHYELGIPLHQINLDEFQYLTRIHYASTGDGTWGEHEIDYILFLQKDVHLNPNSNEISEVRYVNRENIDDYVKGLNAPLTPWFQLILKHRLKLWWNKLSQLSEFKQHQLIERFI